MKNFFHRNRKSMLFGLLYAGLFVSFLVILTVLYWVIVDDNFNPPSELLPQEYTYIVPQGGSFQAKFISHRFRDCYTQVTRTFTNEMTGKQYRNESSSSITVNLEGEERTIEVPLPAELTPGIYSYDSIVKYYCNPANNLFGPVVLDPPKMIFHIAPPFTEVEWHPYNDTVRQIYSKRWGTSRAAT